MIYLVDINLSHAVNCCRRQLAPRQKFTDCRSSSAKLSHANTTTRVHSHAHTHTYIRIYIYMYTYIHTHTHTTCRTHAFPRPALRQHLRDANIKDMDENSVAKKLQERLSANIFSYLQLAALKIKPNTSMHQHKQLETQKARTEYASSLSELVASIHD
jgi:hypothetical protein